MLLRTRLILLVTISLALLFGGIVAAGSYLEELHDRRLAEIAIGGEAALWNQLLAEETSALSQHIPGIAEDTGVLTALSFTDATQLRDAVAPVATRLVARGELSDFQILDWSGSVLFSVSTAAETQRILDAGTIDAVLAGAAPVGLRQVSSERFVVAVAVVLQAGGVPVGVLTLGRTADQLVHRFAEANGAESYLLSLRGRMVHGTNPLLWDQAEIVVPARRGSIGRTQAGEGLYTVTGVPLADMSAGSAGVLVTLRAATETLRAADRITLITVAGGLALAVLTLVALYAILGRAFAPLDQAIAVLQAMARGDTSVTLSAQGDDEIGRIAEAVRAYRRDAIAIAEERRQRELARRRQERFIRRQMATLADALAADVRQEILADLQGVVGPGSAAGSEAGGAGRSGDDEQLGLLAAVMRQLSARVVQQHEHLRELIDRLREALVRETKLAGLEQELAIARHIQTSILPLEYVETDRFGLCGRMRPAREVGGDFYDFFDLGDDRLGLVVADVSGKGVPAAFFMAVARTLLRALAPGFEDPGACLAKVNDTLSENNPEQLFVTVFYGIVDTRTGLCRFANAGHNPPILASAGVVEDLEQTGGIPLGIFDGIDFTEASVTLKPGDALVLYTDGVTEAMNTASELFGLERWQAHLADSAGLPPDRLADSAIDAVEAYAGEAEQADDVTCLVFQARTLSEA